MHRYTMEKKSYQLCNKLFAEEFGAGPRKARTKFNNQAMKMLDIWPDVSFTPILAGSVGEGAGNITESDKDIIFLLNDYICFEKLQDSDVKKYNNIFIIDQDKLPAGYVKLIKIGKSTECNIITNTKEANEADKDKVIRHSEHIDSNIFTKACHTRQDVEDDVEDKDETPNAVDIATKINGANKDNIFNVNMYLQHSELRTAISEESRRFPIHGPASRMILGGMKSIWSEMLSPESDTHNNRKEFSNCNLEMDFVPAIEFRPEHIVKTWIARKRPNKWPSEELIQKIANMPGYVVPVGGDSGIKTKNTTHKCEDQFRICFTTAEIELLQSLNETQMFAYVLLKQLLKEACPCVSSYVIKNVILWILEAVKPLYYQHQFLYPIMFATLHVFKWMVEMKRRIPNYMIPQRNLLSEKLDKEQQGELVNKLATMIERAYEEFPFGIINLTGVSDTDQTELDSAKEIVREYETASNTMLPWFSNLVKDAAKPRKETDVLQYACTYFVNWDAFLKNDSEGLIGDPECTEKTEVEIEKHRLMHLLKNCLFLGHKTYMQFCDGGALKRRPTLTNSTKAILDIDLD